MNQDSSFKTLEEKIHYTFNHLSGLKAALTHRSYTNGTQLTEHNERLEYLGDAILKFVVSEWLYQKFPNDQEGSLSKKRSHIIADNTLAKVGKELGLDQYLYVSTHDTKLQENIPDSLLSNATEALIAAIYLDSNIKNASHFIQTFIIDADFVKTTASQIHDYRSLLQELCHHYKFSAPTFSLKDTQGPEHELCFFIELKLNEISDQSFIGSGKNKKEACQHAAKKAYEALIPKFPYPIT